MKGRYDAKYVRNLHHLREKKKGFTSRGGQGLVEFPEKDVFPENPKKSRQQRNKELLGESKKIWPVMGKGVCGHEKGEGGIGTRSHLYLSEVSSPNARGEKKGRKA